MPKVVLSTDGTLMFHCPGCDTEHGIPVDGSRGWKWNGDLDSPTITPSILTRFALWGPDKVPFDKYKGNGQDCVQEARQTCHSYVTAGRIQFLPDCTHSLAGQTVDLPDWE
jgi:Family of unknown function (DUF6527)